jgi:hypothetical protein
VLAEQEAIEVVSMVAIAEQCVVKAVAVAEQSAVELLDVVAVAEQTAIQRTWRNSATLFVVAACDESRTCHPNIWHVRFYMEDIKGSWACHIMD